MERLRLFWTWKEETVSGPDGSADNSISEESHGSNTVSEGNTHSPPLRETEFAEVDREEGEEEEDTSSLSTSGMTDSFTSGIENVVSSSRRVSQSEVSFHTASLQNSQSDVSFPGAAVQINQSDSDGSLSLSQSDIAPLGSRRASRSDVSHRGNQSDFTSTAASRRSSQPDSVYTGTAAVVRGAASQSGARTAKYGVTSFDPYKRFDLQFVTLTDDLLNFYIKVSWF